MSVLVTGASGMVGRSLQKKLTFLPCLCDLREPGEFAHAIKLSEPSVVIHLAALVGGRDRESQPYTYLHNNMLINMHVVEACRQNGIRLIAISSSAAYPSGPLRYPESMLHQGGTDCYGFSKRIMLEQIKAAGKQYNLRWTVLHASALYGPTCDFKSPQQVIPSMIAKMHAAKRLVKDSVEFPGSRLSARQFLYVDDFTNIILQFLEQDIDGDFNVAYPWCTTIESLSQAVAKMTSYEGEILFGDDYPLSHIEVDINKLRANFADMELTSLEEGLRLTYDAYKETL